MLSLKKRRWERRWGQRGEEKEKGLKCQENCPSDCPNIINFLDYKISQAGVTIYRVNSDAQIKDVVQHLYKEEKDFVDLTPEDIILSAKIARKCRKQIKITLKTGIPTHFKAPVIRNKKLTTRSCSIHRYNKTEVLIISCPEQI